MSNPIRAGTTVLDPSLFPLTNWDASMLLVLFPLLNPDANMKTILRHLESRDKQKGGRRSAKDPDAWQSRRHPELSRMHPWNKSLTVVILVAGFDRLFKLEYHRFPNSRILLKNPSQFTVLTLYFQFTDLQFTENSWSQKTWIGR